MSYSTWTRHLEVGSIKFRDTRDPNRASGCCSWWPDYGSDTQDFCYQHGKHPTNTVFKNCIERQIPTASMRAKWEADQRAAASRTFSGTFGGVDENAPKQFRNPEKALEAMMRSEIMPSRSGRLPKKDGVLQITVTPDNDPRLRRTGSEATIVAGKLRPPPSPANRSMTHSFSQSDGFGSSMGPGSPQRTLPGWISNDVRGITPVEAAGHGGGATCRKQKRDYVDMERSQAMSSTMTLNGSMSLNGTIFGRRPQTVPV
eukprot:gnl/TRDRNA2_/TRDRNA2_45807_c0_seq1.p1 gnl/TRDRNA2_/TRDRNA2_45807_c0~~gnl/TRDRNA2_/TRDRNA2_45807_c0_seq1.p1  ORF type:complete len:258 (-),score=32.67 gnl/TRDRNA2_/TRDRNA2_45807_c0_seq1:50-823(-)